jgi:carboxyl-terminal processing protease
MTPNKLARFARRVALFLFVAASVLLVASLSGKPQLAAPAQAAQADQRGRQAPKDNFDLTQLDTFRKVVVSIKDNYVDPKRIDPKEMFLAALEAVEKSTAEVMVDGNAKEGRVKVTCGNAVKEFKFDDVESIWMIPHRIKPIFAFIQDNLVSSENKRDIEYAAINGMLSTLDPHSWLLKPDLYREMKLQTKGEFGGVGFVIAMEEERLTVKKVLKNTPASRAGVKKGDHISRIEDESTINMDLNDAVSKLRGKPGTAIHLYIKRDKEEERQFSLTRDLISIESVTSQLLPEGVGYVRLASFAGTTSRDLAAAIREMKSQAPDHKLKGLVMDLRSNPGGLLDQAIQVADQFIDEGAIVTTAGMSDKHEVREPKMAHNDGNDREFPITVLVNSESASASEIVAGAMKNLNRAVIIGRQTFGKGSVQVLYDLPETGTKEEAALKLTIAQYLTPGDISIQEIGVTPDIELVPAQITKDKVDLFAPPRLLREADLDKHFANGFPPGLEPKKVVDATEKPSYFLRYLKEEKIAKKEKDGKEKEIHDDEEEPPPEEPDEDQIASDYQVQFARDLMLRAPETDRLGMLSAASAFLQERRALEETKIEKAIGALGIDWTTDAKRPNGTGPGTANVEFKVTPPKPVGSEFVTLSTTVTNTSKITLERLRAYSRCEADKTAYEKFCRLLDRREFLFGKLAPGEKRTWSTTIKVPNYLPATHENLTLVFQEAHNNGPADQHVEVESVEMPRPAFAFTYQVLDKDGLAQPGETVNVQVDVKNIGAGKSWKGTYVSLRSQGTDKVFMKKGRGVIGALLPGETKSAILALEVKHGFDPSQGIPLKIEIGDRDMWEFTTGKINLPAVTTPPTVTNASGAAHIDRESPIIAAPTPGSPLLAEARRGALLSVIAKAGDYYEVKWGRDRVGFVGAGAVTLEAADKLAPNSPPDTKVSARMDHEPPRIDLQGIDPTKAAVVVDGDRFKITGVTADPNGVQDVRIFVDNEKVFFKTVKPAEGDTRGKTMTSVPFSADFPLKPGNNMVLIVSRETDDFLSQRTLVINRHVPPVPVATNKTPSPGQQ